MAYCARLVSEQEVQAMSIDAATANVEVHYAYICDAYGAFMARYQQQAAAHAGACRVGNGIAGVGPTALVPTACLPGCLRGCRAVPAGPCMCTLCHQ